MHTIVTESTIVASDQLRILGALRQHAAFGDDKDGHHDDVLQRVIEFLDNNRNPIVAESGVNQLYAYGNAHGNECLYQPSNFLRDYISSTLIRAKKRI